MVAGASTSKGSGNRVRPPAAVGYRGDAEDLCCPHERLIESSSQQMKTAAVF